MRKNPTVDQIVEEMYLSAWCRLPTAAEKAKALKLFDTSKARIDETLAAAAQKGDIDMTEAEAKQQLNTEAAQDLLWGLINSPAFLFNR